MLPQRPKQNLWRVAQKPRTNLRLRQSLKQWQNRSHSNDPLQRWPLALQHHGRSLAWRSQRAGRRIRTTLALASLATRMGSGASSCSRKKWFVSLVCTYYSSRGKVSHWCGTCVCVIFTRSTGLQATKYDKSYHMKSKKELHSIREIISLQFFKFHCLEEPCSLAHHCRSSLTPRFLKRIWATSRLLGVHVSTIGLLKLDSVVSMVIRHHMSFFKTAMKLVNLSKKSKKWCKFVSCCINPYQSFLKLLHG